MTVCLNTEDLEIFPRQWLEGKGTGDSLILIMDSGVRLSYAGFLVDRILVLLRILPWIYYLYHFTAGSKKRNLFSICVNLENKIIKCHIIIGHFSFLLWSKAGECCYLRVQQNDHWHLKNKTKTEQNQNFSQRLLLDEILTIVILMTNPKIVKWLHSDLSKAFFYCFPNCFFHLLPKRSLPSSTLLMPKFQPQLFGLQALLLCQLQFYHLFLCPYIKLV